MTYFPDPDPSPPVESPSRLRSILAILVGLAVLLAVWVLFFSDSNARPELTVKWEQDSIRVREDAGVVEATVRLSAPAPEDLVIRIEARGTATADEDYTMTASSIGIPRGEDMASVTLLIIDDGATGEDRESVLLGLLPSEKVRIARPDTVSVVIEEPRTAPPRSTTTQRSDVPSTTTTTARQNAPLPPLGDLGVTRLTEGAAAGSETVALGSFTTEPNAVVLLIVASSSSSAPTPIPVVADAQLEWEMVETSTRNDGPRRITMFRAATGVGGTAQTQVEFGSGQEVIDWVVAQVANAPTDQNGATAIVQTGAAAAVDFEFNAAVPLGPLASENSITVGGFFIGANRAEGAEGFETLTTVGPAKRLLLVIVGNDPRVATADWPTRAHWIGVAAEITNEP